VTRWGALLCVGLAGLGGCSSEAPAPASATLGLSLSSPAQDDGAVLLTITGGPVDSIDSPGYRLYSTSPEANTYRVIIAGQLASGPIARVHIPDERRSADYAAVVEQVAAQGSYRQQDLAGYGLSFAR
jgi:hypothetical protein